jgi:hypothetical protein
VASLTLKKNMFMNTQENSTCGMSKFLKGYGIVINRQGCFLTALEDKVLEEKVKNMQKTGKPWIVEHSEDKLDLNEKQRSFIHNSFKELKFIEAEHWELAPKLDFGNEIDFTKPSDFDLGLWSWGEDVGQDNLKLRSMRALTS